MLPLKQILQICASLFSHCNKMVGSDGFEPPMP
jgi:hypothetical protein